MLPEALSLEETRDGLAGLRRAGIAVAEIVVNRVTPPPPGPCALCAGRRSRKAAILDAAARALRGIPLRVVAARGGGAARRSRPCAGSPARCSGLRHVRMPVAPRRCARPRREGATARRPALAPGWSSRTPWWLSALMPPGGACSSSEGRAAWARRRPRPPPPWPSPPTARGHRPVLLLSADPAHSLADVLAAPLGDDERAVPGAPPRLRARELDADRALAAARERYRGAVDQLFDALRGGSNLDPAFDRAVVQDLIELAPPGIDELFALVAVTEALTGEGKADAPSVVVLDTAPTGHALRLLALPDAAREWMQALLSVLLKYREVVGLGRLAQELVDVSKQLRSLAALLRDPARTAFVAVTRPARPPAPRDGAPPGPARGDAHPGGGPPRQRDDAPGLRALPSRRRARRQGRVRPGPPLVP